MNIHKSHVQVFIILLLGFMAACSITSRGIVRSPSSYEEVFKAAIAAASDSDFLVTSSDIQTGSIVAVKRMDTGSDDVMRMHVMVNRVPTGTEVVVTVVQPPGAQATGDQRCKCRVKRFVYALENRVPDVEVMTIQ
jgi:hypothetical protein